MYKTRRQKTFTEVLTKVLSSWIFRLRIQHFEKPLLSSLRLNYGTAVDISNKTVSRTKTPRFNNISTGYSTFNIQHSTYKLVFPLSPISEREKEAWTYVTRELQYSWHRHTYICVTTTFLPDGWCNGKSLPDIPSAVTDLTIIWCVFHAMLHSVPPRPSWMEWHSVVSF